MSEVRAFGLLRARPVWILPVVLISVVIALMTLIYFGSIVDPASHLRGLPVAIVNEDTGADTPTGHVDLGQNVVTGLTGSPAVSSRLGLKQGTLAQAQERMDKGATFATVVIPADFSRSVVTLAGLDVGRVSEPPTVQVLTNPRAGSIGVSLATAVLQPALAQVSDAVSQRILPLSTAAARSNPVNASALANPITSTTVAYRPVPSHAGLGLSAFYLSLLTTMIGFLGATIIHNGVDSALGYATSEMGPWWSQRLPVRITRWQTLLTKWVMSAAIVPVASIIMLGATLLLGLNAPHLFDLWLLATLAGLVIAMGTLVLFAALGGLGQIVAVLVFVYLALASSGGTVPLHALSSFYRFVAEFEPLRQIVDGFRSILFFDARGDAGLTRAFVLTAIGFAFWLVAGVAITRWYDRKGLHRMRPEVLDYVTKAARAHAELEGTAPNGSGPDAAARPDSVATD